MKKVIIPIPEKDSITIAEIQPDDKNLILCYKNNKPVGYFVHFCDEDVCWVFCNTNDLDAYKEIHIADESLFVCVNKGIKDGVFDELRLIEFE